MRIFLQSFFTKSLSKLLLLIVLLAFGGCHSFDSIYPYDDSSHDITPDVPSTPDPEPEPEPILYSFEGECWKTLDDDLNFTSFQIKDGIDTYNDKTAGHFYTLKYTDGGYDWATYEGDDAYGTTIRVEMTNITTDCKMEYTRYENDEVEVSTTANVQ